jgi:hypothetical protein
LKIEEQYNTLRKENKDKRRKEMDNEKTKPSDLKLITREEVSSVLSKTENLTFMDLKPGDDLEVHFHGSKDSPVVNLGGTELRLTPPALLDATRCIGLPQKYTSKCPADMLWNQLNYFFGEGMHDQVRAIYQEDRLIGMTTDRVKTSVVSNERLLRLAEEKIGKEHIVGYHQTHSDLSHSTVALVTDQSFEPVREDTLFGGIKIQNSILGKEAIEVSPYVFRQWCSNGAITSHSLGRYTRKKHDDLDNWFHGIIEGASTELEKEFERIRHLTNISVRGHVTETIKGIGHDRGIPGKVIEQVLEEATSSRAETMYDVYNCFTKIASHNRNLTPVTINRLQWTAGSIAEEHEICKECHRVLI